MTDTPPLDLVTPCHGEPRDRPARAVPSTWHELASDEHPWLEWRLRAALAQLDSLDIPRDVPLRALEVGCGEGTLARQLEAVTAWTVDGVDIDAQAIANARGPMRGRLFHYDVAARRPELGRRYDVLVLFDLIEHVEDPIGLVADALAHLKPDGTLLVNVPACPSLHGRYDIAVGHLRRYNPRFLEAELSSAGLRVRDLRHWGLGLLPVLLARSVLLWASRAEGATAIRRGFSDDSALVRSVLTTLMRMETALLPSAPLGTSLLAAATPVR